MKKMKQIMKDEEGLTLVELLAVVVIMAIIAGIAAVSISKVIQRSREDAQVVNVQQMMASANLYDIQEEEGLTQNTTLLDLKEKGVIKSYEFVKGEKDKKEATAKNIKFSKNVKDGEIYIELPANSLTAGQKTNKPFTGNDSKTGLTESNVGSLTRDKLFGDAPGSESK
ncbi:prepilin-type N-terminal cleavage/methylation domain-containing protein [Vagococcus fluvialis]|uniref:prepilin-type N-terminal cleavage/methylation domain-containing protein n=1 Tax=Vagococcus fluvialis TaxID=2738 RepID=UPI003B5AAD3D